MYWGNFKRKEFACHCGCGFDTVDVELLYVLQELRDHFQKPVIIHSGARCPEQNRRSGGALLSQHLYGKAADIEVVSYDPITVAKYLESKYQTRYGIGRYPTWTHIDVRPWVSRWNKY